MWSAESGKDPGGSVPPQQSSQELADLKDQFEQQQVLISQLKEMLRKTEQTKVSQERVEEMANTLTKMNARAKRNKLKREGEGEKSGDAVFAGGRRQIDTPATEKINLLRQQLEENKAKLAERGRSQRDIEEMVSQIKAQLDDSQNLISQSPLNLSQAEPKIDAYSAETSSQELYRILLIKEKRVSELSSKVQKLEGTVLDLQENIKEKDQVIDARTKAITLMSENLSKKGKHTLDMLEETKQQMRKMQENFVQLESDMEADKQKLLNELEGKNKEIDELRKTNSDLQADKLKLQGELETYKNQTSVIDSYKKQIDELNEKIASTGETDDKKSPRKRNKKEDKSKVTPPKDDVDNKVVELQRALDNTKEENEKYLQKISELENTIKELNVKIETVSISHEGDGNEEIAKLKKQIDESNKNMIKVKAQHKSKIKELTKKIEAFKSVSDTNAEIVRLESENAKLNKKIDDLQQEKDSLLLQLEQSGSTKDSSLLETVEELEQKIKGLSEKLLLKEKELEDLKQKTDVSDRMASAIDSITFEEQLDKLEADKRIIQHEKDDAVQENKILLEKLEQLKKEKHEITIKMEQYMQENMDLIDKLEKLSAEKVSSAESIEIVESLTQQEKMELEAYQKQMELMKTSQENLEPNVELNDCVNQLTEETSELLQKIELFTVERREVMEKMETLSQENAQLNLKVKEIENNRDTLIETYEQLQNEKEELVDKLQKLEDEHAILQDKFKLLQEENEHLRDNVESENEKDELLKRIREIEEELAQKNDDIANLESIVDETKSEAICSATTINNLQKQLDELQNEFVISQNQVDYLNSVINDLNNASNNSGNVEILEGQLGELKLLLNENIQQIENYQKEIADNSKTIDELKTELNRLNDSLLQMEHALHSKDDEIKKLMKDKSNLQEELKTKNENFQRSVEELKTRCLKMSAQIEGNTDSLENIKKPLEDKIEDLTNKNKEQLEKMKKIAANLKKKSAAYQELEEKYGEIKEKWETENKEKEDLKGTLERKDLQIVELNQKITSLVQQLHEVEDELSVVQTRLTQKEKECDDLLEEFNIYKESCMSQQSTFAQEDLQKTLHQYENQITALVTENEILTSQQHNAFNTEIHSKEQEIVRLKDELEQLHENSTTHSNALQAKIQELEMYIENQDAELGKYKERVNKLEEGLNAVEERRLLLEEKTLELGAQLEEKSSSIEEIYQSEDELEKRLEALELHDEAIRKRLREVVDENQDLSELNRQLSEQNDELKHKINLAHNKVSELSGYAEKLNECEQENLKLKDYVQQVENHLKHLQVDFEEKLNEKRKELSIQEADMQEQLKTLYEERRGFMEQIEKLSDQVREYEQKIDEMKESLASNENLEKIEQQEIIIENLKREIQAGNETKVQSDDVLKLKQIISEKEREIEEYQKQNLQLQMQNSFNQNVQFDNLISIEANQSNQLQDAIKKIAELQELEEKYKFEILEHQNKITSLENQLKTLDQPKQVVAESPQIATFSWPQQAEDPFSFISENAETPRQHTAKENTAEELQKKIKTLEFMLYNVEKEKDEAVMQCHQLSNELTHLVYEREQVPKDLTSQILQSEDLVDTPQSRAQLHNLEFEPTKEIQKVVENPQPVVEDVVTPKTAYQCYAEDDDKIQKAIALQIVKEEELVPTPESQKRLHDLEFEKVKSPIEAQCSKPIKEEKAEAKSAYLCYNSPQVKSEGGSVDAFGENDDGWAWGPEEAKLEEEHRQQCENSPQNLVMQLQQLTERVKVLELEREHHLEEIRQAQIKSGKLIKKLKEMKAKNEQLSSQIAVQSSGFPGLDDAIQDEFKLQIENLEKKAKELSTDLAKERLEKENLKKRIDVLTAANERMVEMKERQEVEIMSWKQRNRELESKLEQFDWGDDGFEPSKQTKKQDSRSDDTSGESVEQLKQRIEELNETIRELSLDNEELQALLEEQRNLRINAEKPKYVATAEVEKESLESQLKVTVEEKKKLQDELNVLIQKNDVLTSELQRLEVLGLEKKELETKFANVKNQYDGLMKESVEFGRELLDKLRVAEEENTRLNQHDLNKINEEKSILSAKLAEKDAEILQLNESFNNQLQDQNKLIHTLKTEIEQLTAQITEKDTQLHEINEKYKNANSEFEVKLSTTIEDLTREWVQQVDQRGSDVAESWKLHLEARENEFTQLEQQLRKEIHELEEKYNSMVNENNELRKNVDAEIRNEVDRVAALQQQINDKQSSINEFNRCLLEKENIIETLQSQLLQTQNSLSQLRNDMQNSELKITDYETTLAIKDEELSRNQELINDLNEKLRRTNEEQLLVKSGLVEETEAKIADLQKKLEESEIKFQKLQEELLEKQNALTQSSVVAEEYKFKLQQLQDHNNLLQQELANKDQLTAELLQKLNDLETNNRNTTELQQQLFDSQQQVNYLNTLLQEKDNNLQYLQQEVQNKQEQLQNHESTINRLNGYIEEVKRQHVEEIASKSTELEQILNERIQEITILNRRLTETTHRYEETISNKDNELETLKLQLEEQQKRFSDLLEKNQKFRDNLQTELNEKTTECEELKQKLADFDDEQQKQTTQLHSIIEDQVLRIEELKKELFEKSNDYDALIAEVDMHEQKSETTKSEEKPIAPSVYHETEEDNLLEPVSRAELDLALYMLHQRDVRCEELTMELMQLLEERDTLQLRLSNAIREKEELKSGQVGDGGTIAKPTATTPPKSSPTGAIPKSKASAIVLGATGTELATEAVESSNQAGQSDQLAHKLSELKTVGYGKDKTLVDEKELRRLQELSIMQQHKDIAAKLPPEAAARLVDANYTLSRDVQSPSKVLLNWLWGRSTPKVNDV